MDIRPVSPKLSVAGQVLTRDMPAIAQTALQAGLEVRYLPAESGKVTGAQGAAFGESMNQLPQPAIAYCRTGMHSTTLWALSNVGNTAHAKTAAAARGPAPVVAHNLLFLRGDVQGAALAWYLKERILPPLYWDAMLTGREWLAKPDMVG